jgi:quinol monooxygenase YgiN
LKIMKTKLLVIFFSIALFSTSYGSANTVKEMKNKENAKQTTPDEPGMMIVANVIVKPEKVKDFIEAAKGIIEKSNKEEGCKSYQLYQDPYNSTKFVFVEEYKNQAAIDAHFASEYFKAFGPKIADMVQEPAKIKIISVSKEVMK